MEKYSMRTYSLLLTSTLLAFTMVACDDGTQSGNDEQSTPVESDSRQRLLRDLRDTVYAPTFERFANCWRYAQSS